MSLSPNSSPSAVVPLRPRWDGVRLWLGDCVIRPYERFAPRQAVLLSAFEARGWPTEPIADPFPPEPCDDPEDARKRLRATVENLNRELPRGTIRFRVIGTCVWWEPDRRRRRRARR
jgi:hypothetical protein